MSWPSQPKYSALCSHASVPRSQLVSPHRNSSALGSGSASVQKNQGGSPSSSVCQLSQT